MAQNEKAHLKLMTVWKPTLGWYKYRELLNGEESYKFVMDDTILRLELIWGSRIDSLGGTKIE